MKNYDKFYAFVKELVADEVLSESIIAGHKTIFESEEVIEEGLRETIGAGLLGASLAMAPAARAQNMDNQNIDKTELTQKADVNKTQAAKIIAGLRLETIKKLKKELTTRGGDPEVEETKDFVRQKYDEINSLYGKTWADGFLRSVNWELNEIGGISPIKM
jgi:hypothetical protein